MDFIGKIEEKFLDSFNSQPIIVRAPGRINLIGEHTDYNDGFVLPGAVNRYMYFAMQTNEERVFRFHSIDMNDYFEVELDEVKKTEVQWVNYLLGVIAQLKNVHTIEKGVDCVFGGDIPVGTGMSSSAALECGYVYGLNSLLNLELDNIEMAVISQLSEHQYAGVKCGIMDQYSVLFGVNNKAIKLDCRSLEHELFPIDLSNHSIVLCDTKVSHSLASSEYNKRRKECEGGVEILKKYNDKVKSLRDVSLDLLNNHKSEFDPVVFRRCEYVVKENQRVLDACKALEINDFSSFGKLMYQSHEGLRDKYEVSCEELDELVEIARSCKGVVGSRMMGGGFGGCTISLVENDSINTFSKNVEEQYYKKNNIEPNIIITKIVDGVSIVKNMSYAN